MPTSPTYIHRHNQDGSKDSICRLCFRTIASLKMDMKMSLASQETRHTCQPGSIGNRTQRQTPLPTRLLH